MYGLPFLTTVHVSNHIQIGRCARRVGASSQEAMEIFLDVAAGAALLPLHLPIHLQMQVIIYILGLSPNKLVSQAINAPQKDSGIINFLA